MTIKEFILLTYLFHQQENTLPFKKIVSDLCYKQSDFSTAYKSTCETFIY